MRSLVSASRSTSSTQLKASARRGDAGNPGRTFSMQVKAVPCIVPLARTTDPATQALILMRLPAIN